MADRVLLVDGDELNGILLARAIEEVGFRVDRLMEARKAFAHACEAPPLCIVSCVTLPDIDGFWLVRRIRTETSAVARVPIVLIGDLAGDRDTRAQGLHVGADVVLERPIDDDDVAAQVEALVSFARRLGGAPIEEEPPSSSAMLGSPAIKGDLAMFPLASILMMFELERRTGTIQVVSESGSKAVLTLSHGLFAATELAGVAKPALEVLREVLSWRSGRFSFRPRDPAGIPPPRASVGALVLEAMRLEDEKKVGQ
ncbi:MAG: response regulator [Deltaproteobacteria bacterium]|nr:response regulator [Deltaproteobacteria bacterium]